VSISSQQDAILGGGEIMISEDLMRLMSYGTPYSLCCTGHSVYTALITLSIQMFI
jgi:hypothetical protein